LIKKSTEILKSLLKITKQYISQHKLSS